MKFSSINTVTLPTGEHVYSNGTLEREANQLVEFMASIKRAGAPQKTIGPVELILLSDHTVAVCSVNKAQGPVKELLFPFLTGSEISKVSRHGNCVSVFSGNAVLVLESDLALNDGAGILASQWCRILTRLTEDVVQPEKPSTKTSRPNPYRNFNGLGIAVPQVTPLAMAVPANETERFKYHSTNPSSRKVKQLVPQPTQAQPQANIPTLPNSKTMKRISLCLQKATDFGDNGFGEDLKNILANIDEEPKTNNGGSSLDLPGAPFSVVNLTPKDEFTSSEENSATPSPSKLFLDTVEEEEGKFNRADSIFRKEAEMRSAKSSSSSLNKTRSPPHIPPPVPRVAVGAKTGAAAKPTDQIDIFADDLQQSNTSAGSSTPNKAALSPVSENVHKPLKSPKLMNSMKKLFGKKKEYIESPHSAPVPGTAARAVTTNSQPLSSPTPEKRSNIPRAVSVSSINNTPTSAVPKLDSSMSISSLSFRSLSSRSLAQSNPTAHLAHPQEPAERAEPTKHAKPAQPVAPAKVSSKAPPKSAQVALPTPPPSASYEPIIPISSTLENKFDPKNDHTWFDLEEKLQVEAGNTPKERDSSPTMLHRENGKNFEASPITLDPSNFETMDYNNSAPTSAGSVQSTANSVASSSATPTKAKYPQLSFSNKSMPAVQAPMDRRAIPNSSSISSYSSFGSRRSDSDCTLSASSSFSTPSLTSSFKRMNEMTIFACKMWISKWNGARWNPLSQDELATEITLCDQVVKVSIPTPGSMDTTEILINQRCEVRKISLHDVELKSANGVYMFRGRDIENSQRIFRALWGIIVNGISSVLNEDKSSVRYSVINDKRKTMLPPILSKSNQSLRFPGMLTSTIIEE